MESLEKNLSKSDIEQLYSEAKELSKEGKDQEAAELLIKAYRVVKESEDDIDRINAIYESAQFLSRQGNKKEAIELLVKAAKLAEKRKDN